VPGFVLDVAGSGYDLTVSPCGQSISFLDP